MTGTSQRKADKQPRYLTLTVRLSAADQDLKDWAWENPRMAGFYVRRALRAELIRRGELPPGSTGRAESGKPEKPRMAAAQMRDERETLPASSKPSPTLVTVGEAKSTQSIDPPLGCGTAAPAKAPDARNSTPSLLEGLAPEQAEALLAEAMARLRREDGETAVVARELDGPDPDRPRLDPARRALLESMTAGL